MKKGLKAIVMCFVLLCMSLFTGCSLVETNNGKLYNSVVAEIYRGDNKVAEITNRDLLSGYESYGNLYVQHYNYSVSEAVDMTLKQLENRKIIIMTAEELFGIDYKTGSGLSELEKTYIYEQAVNSLNNNYNSYYNDIVGTTSGEDTNDGISFNGYDKNVVLKYDATLNDNKGGYVIEKVNKEDGLLDGFKPANGYKDYYNSEDRAEIYDNLIQTALVDRDHEKALNLYLLDLKSAEYGMKLSTKTKTMFEREIERLYKINYENYLVQKYSEYNKTSSQISSVTADDILRLYSSKVRAGYTKYFIEEDSSYDSDVSGSVNSVYYFKNDNDSTKYFKVVNILFKFDDNQTAEYNKITANSNLNENYEAELDDLYNNKLKPVQRTFNSDTGNYEGEKREDLSVNDIIYNRIEPALKNAQSTGDVNYVGDEIKELLYTYNEDDGMFSSDANYVIGVDKEGKAVSNFVTEFNDAGLELYNDGKGQIGDMAVARSSYGVHVLIYTGECTNLFDGIDSSFELGGNYEDEEGQDAIEVLYSTRVNLLIDKTYFDVLYDEIYNDSYAMFEQANINFIRENYDIKVYRGRFPKALKG